MPHIKEMEMRDRRMKRLIKGEDLVRDSTP